MGTAVRIGLVEDQPLYRQLMQNLLRTMPGLVLRGVAGSVAEARRALDPATLDVVLLDVRLPDGNGFDLGREMHLANASLGVVLLSAFDQMHVLLELPEAELARWSYLSKSSSVSAAGLVTVLRGAAEGHSVLDPHLILRRKVRRSGRLAVLSSRQRQVLSLIAEGLTNAAIAERLDLASRSVDNHINSVYAALGLSGHDGTNPRVQAVRIFLEESR